MDKLNKQTLQSNSSTTNAESIRLSCPTFALAFDLIQQR